MFNERRTYARLSIPTIWFRPDITGKSVHDRGRFVRVVVVVP